MSGIVAVYGHPDAETLVYNGLYSVQHRGPKGCGISAVVSPDTIGSHTGFGHVVNVFPRHTLTKLTGKCALGHVSSKMAASNKEGLQPVTVHASCRGPLSIAYEGGMLNATELRGKLEAKGAIFQTESDAEIVLHLLAHSTQRSLKQALAEALNLIQGSFCMAVLSLNDLVVARDGKGTRPLFYGRVGQGMAAASETCTFDLIGATEHQEFPRGVVMSLSNNAVLPIAERVEQPEHCAVENFYFLRPDSLAPDCRSASAHRLAIGRALAQSEAQLCQPHGDYIVVPLVGSGKLLAIGFAEELGLPFTNGIVRSQYSHTTAVEPNLDLRKLGIQIKYNPDRYAIQGKYVILLDDSIVRGVTVKPVVELLKKAGAREVHVRIGSPPRFSWCRYDTTTPPQSQLLAYDKSVKEMCNFIGATSLRFLELEALLKVYGQDAQERYCTACLRQP